MHLKEKITFLRFIIPVGKKLELENFSLKILEIFG